MSSDDKSAVLQIDNPSNSDSVYAASQLQFQDFPRSTPVTKVEDESFRDNQLPIDSSDDQTLLTSGSKLSFWEMGFFAQYFDVSTRDVGSRILWSVTPWVAGGTYIDRLIKHKADLYGPLWINVTLIFSMAICGNIANYLSSGDPDSWHYDFAKVGLAASTVSTYTLGVPTALWFFFWFRGCTLMHTLVETICAYAYSLSVYIPISILWTIGIPMVQYILVGVGTLLSGAVLVMSFAPVVRSDPGQTIKFSYLILLVILALHALLALSFLVYFF